MKIVIIGSGIAGLATSIRLAAKGYHVRVIEANEYLGGKLTSFEQDGFRFDAGPSLFTLPHLVDELFELAEKDPRTEFPYTKLDVVCHYFWEDNTLIKAYGDIYLFADEVSKKLGVRAEIVRRYLTYSRKMYEGTSGAFLENSLHKIKNYFSKDTLQALRQIPRMHLLSSMHAINVKKLGHPKLVQLFDRYATYNGSNPYQAPATLNLIPALEYHYGAFYPKKGMHSITESLVGLAQSLGVEFFVNNPVKEIVVRGGRVTGVMLKDYFVSADAVVSNADIYTTYNKLLPSQLTPKRILKQERSSSALIFYWGVKGKFDMLNLHNILFSNHYEEEFESIFVKNKLYEDPTVYINITSKYTSEDAPEGMENWFVLINVPPNKEQDWGAWIPQARQWIIDKIERTLNIELRQHIITEEVLDPRLIERKTSSYQGSLYGTSSNHWSAAFMRHSNFSNKVKGLYFCGGSVHPGGGIPLCLHSAKITSDLI